MPARRREPPRRGREPRYLASPPRSGRAARAARVRRRRLVAAATALGAAVIVVLVIVLSSGGSSGHGATARVHRTGVHMSRARPHRAAPKTVTHSHSASPPPGTLPQTNALPSSTTPQFKSLMSALWAGVVHNSTAQAMPAFFPKAAYLQVKAIPNAGADFQNRLVHGFTLDIAAAHSLLGSGASSARLVSVNVPQGFAHWVGPGACYNRVGYYEVPNARVVYTENGQTRSFGIASMISWRGVWYVVHFGAVLSSGVVDSPTTGVGTSVDTGTC